MIRNHIIDPESSSSNLGRPAIGTNLNATAQGGYDQDPWFDGSNQSSPVYANEQKVNNPYPPSVGFFNQPPVPTALFGMDDNFDNEPPLLEELGIRFDHIWNKTQAVMYPRKKLDEHILDDADLAGPLFFCLLLGSCLLLAGKVHFGYIYGFSVFGCVGMYTILNLLHHSGIDFWRTCSVLGYCLIPVIVLAALSITLNLKSTIGYSLSIISIGWATFAATRILDAKLVLTEQYWLVVYPVVLLYSCFVLITIF